MPKQKAQSQNVQGKSAMKHLQNSVWGQAALVILGTFIVSSGVYFFKFPNNFNFGGVTGIAVVMAQFTPWSATAITFVLNMFLLVIGFLFLGKQFGAKTVAASILFSVFLWLMELLVPLEHPLTTNPFLEFCLAIFLSALGGAILFNINASGGGTDIVAVIIKQKTGFSVGVSLLIIDLLIIIASFAVFDVETALFAVTGLLAKMFVIDRVIESLKSNKYFNIVCDNPDPICAYINDELHRGATITNAIGSYSHQEKYIIFTALYPSQAVHLRNKVKELEPSAFIFITSSSEIIGRGFEN